MKENRLLSRFSSVATALICAMLITACGGGGGSPGTTVGTTPTGSTPSGTPSTGTAPAVAEPVLRLLVVNGNGTVTTTVTSDQNVTIRATIVDASGLPVPGAVVKFSASDTTLVQFMPASGSALTDAAGLATITVKPVDVSSAGALTITVTSNVDTKTASGTVTKTVSSSTNISVTATTVTTPPTVAPKLKLAIVDGSGAAVTTLSGGQSSVIRATVTDASGALVANTVVKFAASDATLVQFTPASASALTDATGIAVLSVKPADFNSAGALTISATANVGLATTTGAISIAVGAAPLKLGALSFTPTPAGPLPAFSAVALNIPVTSNGLPVSTADGLTLTSLCVGDGTATIVPGSVVNGVKSATYTNNGCTRGTDTITAALGSSTQTISIGVSSANIGTIQFVKSALTGTSIVLKGSGGQGRQESAVVTFKVVDQNNNGLAGVDVNFQATTYTGGLTVLPTIATTDASGNVFTTVSSGTIPTPVRVTAQAMRNGNTISGVSDALTVSTGLPIQKAMSMSADHYNIEGLDYDGEKAMVTVLMADQFGNPIADNTTVNFVTEGGAVGSALQGACNTADGGCTVSLKSQAFRPLNGRVTVLAYAQGIEDFVDLNGDGQYSCPTLKVVKADPNDTSSYRPLVDTCNAVPGDVGFEPFTDLGDPFLDAGSTTTPPITRTLTQAQMNGLGILAATGSTFDGVYDAANGDLPVHYNGNVDTVIGNRHWGLNYIRRSAEFIFSGSVATLTRQVCDSAGQNCRDWNSTDGIANVMIGLGNNGGAGSCSNQILYFRLADENNNPLPYGTTVVGADVDKVTPQTFFPGIIPSTTAIGGTHNSVNVKSDADCARGSFTVKVTTPKGIVSAFSFSSN